MSDERDREEDYGFEVDPPVFTFYAEEKKPSYDNVDIDARLVNALRKIEDEAEIRGAMAVIRLELFAALGIGIGIILVKILF